MEKIITNPKEVIAQIYARVSSMKQEKWSPQAQVEILIDYCKRNGFTYLEPIIETGSGESITGRPELQKVLDFAEEKLFNLLLVIEWERLTRDETLQDTVIIKGILRENKIRYATAWHTFDFSDDEDDFVSDLFSILSKREKKKFLKRSKRGRHEAKKYGHFLGEFLPYGYTTKQIDVEGQKRKNTKIVFDEEQKPGLEKIVYFAINDNMTSRQIAIEMTKLGFKTKTGKTVWNKATILQLLQCTWLYGKAPFFRKKTKVQRNGEKIVVENPKEDWMEFDVPAIVTVEQWNLIQKQIQQRRLNSKRNTVYQYLVSHILKCGHCLNEAKKRGLDKLCRLGTRTDWYSHTKKNGEKVKEARYPYYLCNNRSMKLVPWSCGLQQIRATVLDSFIWHETEKILKNPSLIKDSIVLSSSQKDERKESIETDIKSLEENLAKIKEEKKRVVQNLLLSDSFLSKQNEAKEMIESYEKQIADLEANLKELREIKFDDNKPSIPLEQIEQTCKSILSSINDYTFEMKKKMVETLYEQIIVDPDWTITLQGKIPLLEPAQKIVRQKVLSNSTQSMAFADFQASHTLCEKNTLSYAHFCIKTKLFKDTYYWDTHKIPSSTVAQILGISVKTLKNRENRGFYPKPRIHPHSYYRYYSPEEVELLKKINREQKELIKNRKHLKG